ncbi:MAG: SPOR domain-containing protein, partial [Firmicutes bacterium]|nr:SPOR domain-containing protein [Bacillota bacterium]
VKYKVKVGPYPDYVQASRAAEELRAQGYPIYLANRSPFMVQVGAFTREENALALQAELAKKGYQVAVQKE